MRERTCALVVVGNEVLSGKTQDSNAYFAARQLRAIGVALQRITVIPDEIPLIAEEVSYCARRFDVVLTSGGVGPTHDDVTMDGVAAAFGRKLMMHPELERLIRTHFADRLTAAALKMAAVPEGAVLNSAGDLRFPTIQLENVYILPGIPQIFEAKLNALMGRFATDPYYMRDDLYFGGRRRDRRASQSVSCALPRSSAGLLSTGRGSGLPGEADARIQGPRLSGAGLCASDESFAR